jgi:hypothetical protein
VSLSSVHLTQNINLRGFKALGHFICWHSGSA